MSGDAKLILPNKSLLPGATKVDFDVLSSNYYALSSNYVKFMQNTNSTISDLQDSLETVAAKSLKVNIPLNISDPWNNVNPITHKAMWNWGDVYLVLLNGILFSRVSYTEDTKLELTAFDVGQFNLLTIYIERKSANWETQSFNSPGWHHKSLTVKSVLIFTAST